MLDGRLLFVLLRRALAAKQCVIYKAISCSLVGESGHKGRARLQHVPLTRQAGLERIIDLELIPRLYPELAIGNMPLNLSMTQFTHL